MRPRRPEFTLEGRTIVLLRFIKRNLRSVRALGTMDLILSIMVYPAGCVMWLVRRIGVGRLPACRAALVRLGVFPIRHHYYEPLFDPRDLSFSLERERSLPGVHWNLGVNCSC